MTARDDKHIDRLVGRAVRGDADAFGDIYDALADRVYSFVRARIGDHHEAEDVTETVFLKAFEAISTYDRRGLPFGAWLFRIARNATVDALRKRGRTPDPEEDIEPLLDPDPVRVDDEVAALVDGESVLRCVRELTEDQAAVVACRFYWDMDIRETARTLGRTEGAVKALQHRALRNLARMLEESGANE